MPAKQGPQAHLTEKVQSAYKKLSIAANDLNTASDELGKAISILDSALKKLNLGVSAWVQLSGNEHLDGEWWSRDVGYTRIRDKWGIALKTGSGNYNDPDGASEEIWLFNEAPRWMRTEAVGRIPDLFEALLKQAEDTTKMIKDKTAQAYELAAAMSKVAEEAQTAEQKGGDTRA